MKDREGSTTFFVGRICRHHRISRRMTKDKIEDRVMGNSATRIQNSSPKWREECKTLEEALGLEDLERLYRVMDPREIPNEAVAMATSYLNDSGQSGHTQKVNRAGESTLN